MSPSQAEPTTTLYDHLSRWYDALSASERPLIAAGVHSLRLQPGERLLELGSGTGWALAGVAGQVQPCGLVLGLDRSPGMLAAARRRLAHAGLRAGPSCAALCRADAAHLPFPSAGFDALFSSFTLELFPGLLWSQVLSECWRVLRPGGRMGVVCLLEVPQPGRMNRAYNWVQRHFPRLVDCRPIPLAAWLRQAGFQVGAIQTCSMWGLPVGVGIGVRPL